MSSASSVFRTSHRARLYAASRCGRIVSSKLSFIRLLLLSNVTLGLVLPQWTRPPGSLEFRSSSNLLGSEDFRDNITCLSLARSCAMPMVDSR